MLTFWFTRRAWWVNGPKCDDCDFHHSILSALLSHVYIRGGKVLWRAAVDWGPPSIASPALDGSGRVSDRRDAAQSVEHVCVSQVLAGRRSKKKKKRCAVYSIRRRRKERATRREICSPTAARFASKRSKFDLGLMTIKWKWCAWGEVRKLRKANWHWTLDGAIWWDRGRERH